MWLTEKLSELFRKPYISYSMEDRLLIAGLLAIVVFIIILIVGLCIFIKHHMKLRVYKNKNYKVYFEYNSVQSRMSYYVYKDKEYLEDFDFLEYAKNYVLDRIKREEET